MVTKNPLSRSLTTLLYVKELPKLPALSYDYNLPQFLSEGVFVLTKSSWPYSTHYRQVFWLGDQRLYCSFPGSLPVAASVGTDTLQQNYSLTATRSRRTCTCFPFHRIRKLSTLCRNASSDTCNVYSVTKKAYHNFF